MKKLLIIMFAFMALNMVYEAGNYPFIFKETGNGNQANVLILGFAPSADVWKETVEKLKPHRNCYVIKIAGFVGMVLSN